MLSAWEGLCDPTVDPANRNWVPSQLRLLAPPPARFQERSWRLAFDGSRGLDGDNRVDIAAVALFVPKPNLQVQFVLPVG